MKTYTLFVVMTESHSGPMPFCYSNHYRNMEKRLGELVNNKNMSGEKFWLEEWQVTPVETVKMS